MNGIALTVLISQLPKLFGFSIEADGPLRSLWAIATAILRRHAPTGPPSRSAPARWPVILLLKRHASACPGILIAVVGATVVVGVLDLSEPRGRVGAGRAAARPAGVRDPVDRGRRPRAGR